MIYGALRKMESFRKAIAYEVPWNKNKRADLIKELRKLRSHVFDRIQGMMK